MEKFKLNDRVLYIMGSFKSCVILATRGKPYVYLNGVASVPNGYDYIIANENGDLREMIAVKKQHLVPVTDGSVLVV